MSQSQAEILEEVRSLEAYFMAGLNRATGLRRKLEGFNPLARPSKGLSEKEKAELIAKRTKSQLKK